MPQSLLQPLYPFRQLDRRAFDYYHSSTHSLSVIPITAITITVITVFTEGVSRDKGNIKLILTIYILYNYILYI